ncbi:hypothetical protein TorRG33x02_147900 [Trema orientale]|uniref:Uncharacterized protein n=1 Tax=Trema orientale TaxID=63057 RepID=A0A2P5EV68_TREOI|nr:hypothetical protein TorRG33x02_147900 [Trema orientale]
MTVMTKRVQPYSQCHERRSSEVLVDEKPRSGRKLQDGRSLFSGDEIRRDLAAWLHWREAVMAGQCIG